MQSYPFGAEPGIHRCIHVGEYRGGGILSGKINFGKILIGEIFDPGGKKFCTLRVWKDKKGDLAQNAEEFWHIFFVND